MTYFGQRAITIWFLRGWLILQTFVMMTGLLKNYAEVVVQRTNKEANKEGIKKDEGIKKEGIKKDRHS